MTDFIDPNEFENEDELFSYILEHLVKPRLREALGDEGDIEQVSGMVYVFGGRGAIEQDTIERVQELVQEGMDLDYVLREMTDLEVRDTRETKHGDLVIRYVELARDEADDVEPVSSDELAAMFHRGDDADDRTV